MVKDRMALASILPNGDLVLCHAGRTERSPGVRIDHVCVGCSVILRNARGNGPNQTLSENLGIILVSPAELMIEIIVRVGIGTKSWCISFLNQRFRKSL